jgi:ATP-dependent Lon protease
MESGVRNLDRAIGAICRTVAYEYAIAKDPKEFKQVVVNEAIIREALGNPRFDFKLNERITRPGIAIV